MWGPGAHPSGGREVPAAPGAAFLWIRFRSRPRPLRGPGDCQWQTTRGTPDPSVWPGRCCCPVAWPPATSASPQTWKGITQSLKIQLTSVNYNQSFSRLLHLSIELLENKVEAWKMLSRKIVKSGHNVFLKILNTASFGQGHRAWEAFCEERRLVSGL